MKKHKRLAIFVVCAVLVVGLLGGLFAYRHKKSACTASSSHYPMCLGGCYDPSYYNQHIDFCKNV